MYYAHELVNNNTTSVSFFKKLKTPYSTYGVVYLLGILDLLAFIGILDLAFHELVYISKKRCVKALLMYKI